MLTLAYICRASHGFLFKTIVLVLQNSLLDVLGDPPVCGILFLRLACGRRAHVG